MGHFGAAAMISFMCGTMVGMVDEKMSLFLPIAIILAIMTLWQFRLGLKEFPDG